MKTNKLHKKQLPDKFVRLKINTSKKLKQFTNFQKPGGRPTGWRTNPACQPIGSNCWRCSSAWQPIRSRDRLIIVSTPHQGQMIFAGRNCWSQRRVSRSIEGSGWCSLPPRRSSAYRVLFVFKTWSLFIWQKMFCLNLL